jgi:hyperosmotically inducible periplasmic protein
MRRQNIGYAVLAAALLIAPACSRSDDNDTAGTDRPSQITNDKEPAEEPRRPTSDERRIDGTTGTTGSARQNPDEAGGAGPDAIITMKIQAKYAGDDVVKGRDVEVDTTNGVVTLKGSVDSLHERDAAEQLARETSGVKRVINELKVAATR